MGTWRNVGVAIGVRCFATVAAVALCGCAAIDQFEPRAQDYNRGAAQSKSNQILLNILRSAYSQPLQFTDVSTVSATASVNGSISETIPFPLNLAARTGSRSISASPSASLTGGNTVSVVNLNTQEFYQGLQKPLATSQVTYYLFTGFYDLSAFELLPLFISEIDVSDGKGRKSVLRNAATNPISFGRFYFASAQLLHGGLYTEPAGKASPTDVGPKLDESEAKDPKLLSALVSTASGSDDKGGFTLTAVKDAKSTAASPMYQLQKEGGAGGGDRFCFSDIRYPNDDSDRWQRTPIHGKSHVIYLMYENGRYTFPVTIPPSQYCGNSPGAKDRDGSLKVSVKTRSLQEMFYFLGQIVRTELGLASGVETSLSVPMKNKPEFSLFHVERRLPIGEEPWAMFNGQVFSVRIDASGERDASSRVLQLITDLLALQSSAKNFPAPNLIAITQ